MKEVFFGSLFAGIGGFDLGFERAGMKCKWQVEINEYASKILAKHWPKVHRETDICGVGKHNLKRVDVICGGFPCQDISFAGLGAGLAGARSGLFFEAVRVVCELRPKIVVLENVAALLSRGMAEVLGCMAEIGYDAEWYCFPAGGLGAPHIRDRMFIILQAVPDEVSHLDSYELAPIHPNHEHKWARWRKWKSGVNEEARGVSSWSTEPGVERVVYGLPNRVDRIRGLGNSVVPQVAEFIGEIVMDRMKAIRKREKCK